MADPAAASLLAVTFGQFNKDIWTQGKKRKHFACARVCVFCAAGFHGDIDFYYIDAAIHIRTQLNFGKDGKKQYRQ